MNIQSKAAPPKPKARKNDPVNAKFEAKAKDLVREAMASKDATVDQLTERLALIGVEMSSGGVANKISRGGFSSAFFLQCMDALNLDLTIQGR